MKTLFSSIALVAMTSLASAGHYDNNYTYAKVVDVKIVYENYQVPQERRVCRDERRDRDYNASHRSNNAGGAILGGIIGGVIGHQFGKGHGRDAATAAGAIAGVAIGSNAKRHNNNRGTRKHCYTETTYYDEQRIAGYDVAYKYNGNVYHSRLQSHPGDRVRIQVNVQIAEY